MKQLVLPSKTITENSPVYLIAEMSANHGGSLTKALEIVHAAKESGAHCIKTQTYTADTLTLPCNAPDFQIHGGLWDGYTFHDLYQDAYTPWEWNMQIKEETEKLGMDFFSTPFDVTAVDHLEELGIGFYKVAAFELVDIPLLRYIAQKGKPMILSTGMATEQEMEEAVAAIRGEGNEQIALLKCSSNYPALPEDMNLTTISAMRKKFPYIIGFSDHSMDKLSSVIAVSLGARIIEKHLCISRSDKTLDSGFSLEPHEFADMARTLEKVSSAIGTTPYMYSQRELDSRNSRRSLYAARDIAVGETFNRDNVRSVRPGKGLHTRYYDMLLGKAAAQDIPFGTALSLEMVK